MLPAQRVSCVECLNIGNSLFPVRPRGLYFLDVCPDYSDTASALPRLRVSLILLARALQGPELIPLARLKKRKKKKKVHTESYGGRHLVF